MVLYLYSMVVLNIRIISCTWLLLHCKSVGGQGSVWTWEISWLSSKELWLKGSLALDHLAAMGNHACCGHNAVAEPEAVAPVPENAEKPQEETVETLELAAKDVIIETTSKEVEEIPSPPTSPSSADMRKAFGGKVVSSCSLQGIHVDEDAEAKKQITAQRLRADTQQSVMSMMLVMMVVCMSEVVSCFEILFGHLVLTQISWLVSPRIYAHPVGSPGQAPRSIVEVISDFFRGSSRPDFNGEWVCIATWGCSECKLRARIDTVSWHHAAPPFVSGTGAGKTFPYLYWYWST